MSQGKGTGEQGKQAKEGAGQSLDSVKASLLSSALDLEETETSKTGVLAPEAHGGWRHIQDNKGDRVL